MKTFLSILRFELKFQLTGPVFIVSYGFFFLMAYLATVAEQVQIRGPVSVNVNAPSALALTFAVFGIFGLFIPTAMLASAVIRDREYGTAELFHSTPVGPKTFIMGRFTGGFVATVLAFSSVPLAVLIGTFMPWLDPETLGPTRVYDYFYVFSTLSVVNLFVAGMIFFTVSNLTRSVFATYVTLIAFLILYFVGASWAKEPAYRAIGAILDPLGLNTLREAMQYWTPAQRNTELVPLTGNFLINRVLWSSVALGLLVVNVFAFSFRSNKQHSTRKKKEDDAAPDVRSVVLPRITPEVSSGWPQLVSRLRFETRHVVRSVAFWILLFLGVLNTFGSLVDLGNLYGTESYALTRIVLNNVTAAFSIIPLIVAVYYASELVWRERQVGISDVVDATPTPSWVFVASKFVALATVIVALFLAAIGTGMFMQLVKGAPALELGQYAQRVVVDMVVPFIILAVLCIFVQVVSNNRWLGMLAVVLYLIVSMVAANFGYDHNLAIYNGSPSKQYSDMNGYGHFIGIELWFSAYWAFWAGLLGALSYALWNRGALRPFWERVTELPRSATGTKILGGACTVGVLVTGAWIFYNTNVVNTYMNQPRTEVQGFAFEDRYKAEWEFKPVPTITAVDVTVDIYPKERRADFAGTYALVNRTGKPLDVVMVDYDRAATVIEQRLPGASLREADDEHNVFIFDVVPPWTPDEERILTFNVKRGNPGFRNDSNLSKTNFNGTFLNNGDGLPALGFNFGKLVQARNVRRRYDRKPLPRAPDLDDERYFTVGPFRQDSHAVDFACTISTSPDQIAIAPGYLEKEWEEDGRRYFRYAMDRPIQNFFSFQSARYEVKTEMWQGLKLQVFHHPDHDWNVDTIMKSMRESLAYFSREFSPFQYRQMRVLEFPGYATFAQSFANTVPYSEGIGFVLDQRDSKSFDVVYYVTAHEVAHQWWGHQLTPSINQGMTMLVESFAQYSALIALEAVYGEHQMRRFLKYELDRYLRGRSSEPEAEKPLYRVENQQYIHYRKGSVILYELRDRLGEQLVNRSLKRLIDEWAGKTDPYPRSVDFLKILREEAGPEHGAMITDMFEKIILYDLRTKAVDVAPTEDGKYRVSLTVSAAKIESNEKGEETEVTLGEGMAFDIGVFSQNLDDVYEGDGHVLHMEKHVLQDGEQVIEVIVDEAPVMVGVDPYNKMIDRQSDDNVKLVTADELAAN